MGDEKVGSPMAQKAVQFVRGKMGQQVGSGECYDLADQALVKAGAKSAPAYGKITDDADYVWGEEIDAKDALPGDVIQFRDSGITTVTTTVEVVRKKDGSWSEKTKTETQTISRPHHTAVVDANPGNGVVTVLEQNVTLPGKSKPTRKVVRNALPWKDSETRKPKTITPLKNGATLERTVTIEVTVSGTIWVYRAQPK